MFTPDLSPIENVWFMVAKRLVRHHTPVTMVVKLWHHIEAVWACVPVHTFQYLYDSTPRCISAVKTPRVGCSGY
ncbi:hypothetical protein TNCV_3031611 [Trichonephila clavipes]|nr:hypothetical protein TNCV_3031611 [Trichonephila clavipes]